MTIKNPPDYRDERRGIRRRSESDNSNRSVTADDLGVTLARRLQEARSLNHLEQAELAQRIGVPASSISHFEGGRRKPNVENLFKLAEALDVSVDYLMGRTGDRAAHLDRETFFRLGDMDRNERDIMMEIANVLASRSRKW